MGHSRFRASRLAWFGATLLALAMAAPASAQVQVTIQFGRPQARGFSNNYPWFNDVPQYRGNQTFQYFLAYHPDIAQALALNPGLLYDAAWRSEYPDLEQYLNTHPYEWQALNNANWSTGPAETQWGYYDNQHQWRDAYWWHENDANWFYDNHQDWASLDSRWLIQDGAYDQQNQWHYGEWWYNQNPAWVTSNHPVWLSQHQNWSSASEQQSYRQAHALPAQNQLGQRASVQARPVAQASRQQNQSAVQASRQQSSASRAREPSAGPACHADEPSAESASHARKPSASSASHAREPSAGSASHAREPSAGSARHAREPSAGSASAGRARQQTLRPCWHEA